MSEQPRVFSDFAPQQRDVYSTRALSSSSVSFKDKYLAWLKKFEVSFHEKYVFKFI